jgi:hypothetical protein
MRKTERLFKLTEGRNSYLIVRSSFEDPPQPEAFFSCFPPFCNGRLKRELLFDVSEPVAHLVVERGPPSPFWKPQAHISALDALTYVPLHDEIQLNFVYWAGQVATAFVPRTEMEAERKESCLAWVEWLLDKKKLVQCRAFTDEWAAMRMLELEIMILEHESVPFDLYLYDRRYVRAEEALNKVWRLLFGISQGSTKMYMRKKWMFPAFHEPCVFLVQHAAFHWSDEALSIKARRLLPSNQSCNFIEDVSFSGAYWEGPRPAWHPTRDTVLAIVSGESVVIILDAKDRHRMTVHSCDARITCLQWSGGKDGLIVCLENGGVRLFENAFVNSETKLMLFEPKGYCELLAVCDRQPYLFAGIWRFKDGAVEFRVWDIEGIVFACSLRDALMFRSFHCSWHGSHALFCDGVFLKVFSISTGRVEMVMRSRGLDCVGWRHPYELLVLPSGSCSDFTVVTDCPTHPVMFCSVVVHVFDGTTGMLIKSIPRMQDSEDARIWKVAVSRSGRLAVLFLNGELLIDPDIRMPDVPFALMAPTFSDNAMHVEASVQHMAERINKAEIKFDDGFKGEWGSCGEVRFGTFRRIDVAVKSCIANVVPNVAEFFQLATVERHPNLVRYIGYYTTRGNLDDELHLVTEWMRGGSNLKLFLERNVHVSLFQRVYIGTCVAEGLKWLHMHDLIHGDLKANNIVGDAEFWQVKLIDLGCTRPVKGHVDMDGKVSGQKYPKKRRLCIEDDVDQFVSGILVSALRLTAVKKVERKLETLITWLEMCRFHMLRHMSFSVTVISTDGSKKVERVRQYRGAILWEDAERVLKEAGAQLLDRHAYRLFTVGAWEITQCFVASIFRDNGSRQSGDLEDLFNRSSEFAGWCMPIEEKGRLPSRRERWDKVAWFGPVLCFENTSCDFPGRLCNVCEEEFDKVCGTDHVADGIPQTLKTWIRRSNNHVTADIIPWCL